MAFDDVAQHNHVDIASQHRVPLLGQWFTLDYAYTSMGELQNVHAFSFELGGTQ